MDPLVYVSLDGDTQTVVSPVVAVRLRVRGWRPRAELEKAAEYDQVAAEQLRRADAVRQERAERRQHRMDALEPWGVDDAQEKPPAGPDDSTPSSGPKPKPKPKSART